MPVHSVEPDDLLAVVRALGPLRERVADGEDELLGLVVTPGQAQAQAVADDLVDHGLDALRALGEEARVQALALRNTALAHGAAESRTVHEARALHHRERG